MFKSLKEFWKTLRKNKMEIILIISAAILIGGGIYWYYYLAVDSRDCTKICRLNGTEPELVSHTYGCVCRDGSVFGNLR